MQCLLGSALNVLDKSRTRIPTLDGWRGVAILMVLLSHTGIALRGVLTIPHAESIGQHGVAIFFVLSGYLITSRLMQEEEAFGSVSLGSFYIRRFFRLMPCAWTFMLFAFVLTLGAHPRPFTGKDVVASLCFFRNYVETNGAHPITGHFWSLSIEEQFYLVWPSVLIFCGTRWARWAAVAGAAGVALYRLHAWTFLAHQPLQATFGTQYRADALLTGCAGALFLPLLRPYLRSWMIVPLLGSLAWSVCVYRQLIPLHEAVVIVLLLILTSERPGYFVSRMLEMKPLAVVGVLSYSLYIWQQLFLLTVHTWEAFVVALFLLPAVASASYFWIERPFIRRGAALAARYRSSKTPIPVSSSV